MEFKHEPVLLKECIEGLDIKEDENSTLILDIVSQFSGKQDAFIIKVTEKQLHKIDVLKDVLLKHQGTFPVEIDSIYGKIGVHGYTVDASDDLIQDINNVLGN